MLAPQAPITKSFLLARLESVRNDLSEVLDRLDQTMMDWAPATGMRTLSGQLVEIAITEMQILLQLKNARWLPDEAAKELVGDCQSLANLSQVLSKVRLETYAYIESLTSQDLDELVPIRTLGLPLISRSEVIRTVAQHEYYHVGQIVSYLWMRGDDPYKW